jgi:hypothetical protein
MVYEDMVYGEMLYGEMVRRELMIPGNVPNSFIPADYINSAPTIFSKHLDKPYIVISVWSIQVNYFS